MINYYNDPSQLLEAISDVYNNMSMPVTSGLGAVGGAAVGAGSSYAAYKIAKDKLLKQLEACTDSKCRDDIQEEINHLNQTMMMVGTGATVGGAALGGGMGALAKYKPQTPEDLSYAVANGMLAAQDAAPAPPTDWMGNAMTGLFVAPMVAGPAYGGVKYGAHGVRTLGKLKPAYNMVKGGIDSAAWRGSVTGYKQALINAKKLAETDPDAAKLALTAAKDTLKNSQKIATGVGRVAKVAGKLKFLPRVLKAASMLARVV